MYVLSIMCISYAQLSDKALGFLWRDNSDHMVSSPGHLTFIAVWARVRVLNFTEKEVFFIDFACPRFYENRGIFIVKFLVFT